MRSFKKIAAMIMAVAMLCSFTAFAATVTSVTVADTTTVANTANVVIASDAAQNTILAYKGTPSTVAGANVVYIDQLNAATVAADGVSFQLGTDAADAGEYTVVVGGTDVSEARTATFNHDDATPKYTVTMEYSDALDGTVSWEEDISLLQPVNAGTVITFKLTPHLGCELVSLLVNGEEKVESVVNGIYVLEVTADTTIKPVFDWEVASGDGKSYTYAEMFDLEAGVEEGDVASKLTFGQAEEKTDAEIVSMGMYVQEKVGGEWTDFYTKGDEHYGPEFAAARWTNDYRYGVRFFGFAAGTYKVWSYVKYSDGTVLNGDAIEFTVE